ncbi:Hypothetical_protein [Hexamita inflata]|uniref:Hypothetical_protein n=1 Tax=Hexamita inflata TaxID=28002 RepID=A0AA86Q0S5_9EUKA|nr:Hypothetical protein HINF_LOCUS30894 [Hexamita inflata]
MFLLHIYYKSIVPIKSYSCNQQIIEPNNQQIGYCEKILSMNAKIFKGLLYFQLNSNQMFIFSQNVKNSKFSIKVENLISFSIFGFSNQLQLVNVKINVSLQLTVVEAALLCHQCNIISQDGIFVFIANGNRIGGLILCSESEIQVLNTSLQFRINGLEQGGIVQRINKYVNIFLADVNISGSFNTDSLIGNIVAHILDSLIITTKNYFICSNSANNYATINEITNWNLVGIINIECFTYGLCLPNLQNGQIVNNQLICLNDFIFMEDSCQCKPDFVLNGTVCINILQFVDGLNSNLQQFSNNIGQNFSQLNNQKDINISTFESQLLASINSINTSMQNNYIESYQSLTNCSQTIINKINYYDDIIYDNQSIFNNHLNNQINISAEQIVQSNSSIFNNITINEIILDQVISNISSTLDDELSDIQKQLSDSIYDTKKDMHNKIYNAKQMLNREIQRIKCIHGDCENIQGIIVTGINNTLYCSNNTQASHVCDVYNSFRTVTVPGTCKLKLNAVSGNLDLYTYCCSPQGYWNEETDECEYVTYTSQ